MTTFCFGVCIISPCYKGWNGKNHLALLSFRNKWRMSCLEISVWRRDVEEDMWTAEDGFQRVSQYYIIDRVLVRFEVHNKCLFVWLLAPWVRSIIWRTFYVFHIAAVQQRASPNSVADPHHVNADPDHAFHFDADLDPTFHSDADTNPTFQFYAEPDPTTNFFMRIHADPDPQHCLPRCRIENQTRDLLCGRQAC